MNSELLQLPPVKNMVELSSGCVYRDGNYVWRTTEYSLKTLERGWSELEYIKTTYGIPYAEFQIVPTQKRKGIAVGTYIEGISLDPVLDTDWSEERALSAKEYLAVFTPLDANEFSIITALDHYWSAYLDYQLSRTTARQDFLCDLDPVHQVLFVDDHLVITDTDPEFLSKWKGNSRGHIAGTIRDYMLRQLIQLKITFPQTTIAQFSNASRAVEEVKHCLGLDVANPFDLFDST